MWHTLWTAKAGVCQGGVAGDGIAAVQAVDTMSFFQVLMIAEMMKKSDCPDGSGLFLPGYCISLLCSGAEYFPALIGAIKAAKQEIYLQTYIFADDATGQAVSAALCDAARRGVSVRVMVDGFGGEDFPEKIRPALVAEGVEVLIFRPRRRWSLPGRFHLRRLHRKLCVVDRSVAFAGGINVIDDRNTPQPMGPRFDFAVEVKGPVVAGIHASMIRLWRVVSLTQLRRRGVFPCGEFPSGGMAGSQRVGFLLRDNLRYRHAIEQAYLAVIANAREEIILSNAYFLPGRRLMRAILDAARRGVRVSLLLQGRIEYGFQHYATQSYYATLLEAGVRIFEYQESFLHAKVAVIDGQWATVGSSNVDPFSLLLAREANVVVDDAAFAASLRAELMEAIEQRSREIAREHWRHSSAGAGFLQRISYALLRACVVFVCPAEPY
ncbi:cardiolipin synthase ClsB [Formivibrio citricus]|nr:cardiolipin synthase ClsB [Formivibrio citricus]